MLQMEDDITLANIEASLGGGFVSDTEEDSSGALKTIPYEMLHTLDKSALITQAIEFRVPVSRFNHTPNELRTRFNYNFEGTVLSTSRYSDIAITERVLQRFHGNIYKIESTLIVFDFETRTWTPQDRDESVIRSYIKAVLLDCIGEEEFLEHFAVDSKGQFSETRLARSIERYQSNNVISRVVDDLKNSVGVPKKSLHDFDKEKHILYCNNGVLDMLTGELRQPTAKDMLLRKVLIDWDPDATCYWWTDSFLPSIYHKNMSPKKMIDFMQILFGYTLSGSIDSQKIFIHEGSGSNGKSKILETLELLLGDYSERMTASALVKNRDSGATQAIERIMVQAEGKRCLILDDLDTATKWNEGLVKNLTAKKLIVRELYKEVKTVPNRAKVHIGCNEMPKPESENFGILRRLCIIRYGVKFKQDADMEAIIASQTAKEASGILRWAVEGYRKLVTVYQHKIPYPKEVLLSLQDYVDENFAMTHAIGDVFEPKLTIEDGGWVYVGEILKTLELRWNIYLDEKQLIKSLKSMFGTVMSRSEGRGIDKKLFCYGVLKKGV